jgi:two-component system sensor histidine kinase PilS (NtrC family)
MAVPLRRKLLWLIGARAVAVTVLMGSAILVQVNAPGAFPVNPFFFLMGLTYALTALYASTLAFAEEHRWMIELQLAADAVIASAIVYLTGGVTSYFSSLYTLPIVAASVLQYRRGGLTVGAASALLYVGLVVSQYTGALQLPGAAFPELPPLRVAAFTVGLNLFGFISVALLSAYLAEGLRRADARLQTTSSQLADLRAFNQHVIDSLTSGLLTTDQRGTLLTFNRAAEAITGVPARAAVGRKVTEVLQLPTSWSADAAEHDWTRSRRLEVAHVRPDGRAIEIGLTAAPLVTPTGQVGFLVTFQDVTEIKRLDREMRIQQRLAAVGEMAAGMAHEIRNPLASMSGSLQMLRQELPLSSEQAQLMDIVLRESERLNDTIRSFLAYARPQRVSSARLDLRRVMSDAATLLRNSAEFSDAHEIRLDLPDQPVWYDADEGQIRQIVWNLATNGLRAMPNGGCLAMAAAVDGASQAEVVLSVQDEGVGIPAEEIDRIFQPFRSAFERGTGLGLAIVHRIVSDYGGQIQVTSQPGAGTTVHVHLPVEVAGAQAQD